MDHSKPVDQEPVSALPEVTQAPDSASISTPAIPIVGISFPAGLPLFPPSQNLDNEVIVDLERQLSERSAAFELEMEMADASTLQPSTTEAVVAAVNTTELKSDDGSATAAALTTVLASSPAPATEKVVDAPIPGDDVPTTATTTATTTTTIDTLPRNAPEPQIKQGEKKKHDKKKKQLQFQLTPEQMVEVTRLQSQYVMFWNSDELFVGVYCQWFPSEFRDGLFLFHCAEQYMMAAKARIFQDFDSWMRIMMSNDAHEIKQLGRGVAYYEEQLWSSLKFDVVYRANLLKFSQNPALKQQLLDTGSRVLVEASPFDKVWGIGLAADDPRAVFPSLWLGNNLLGQVLMIVRTFLSSGTLNRTACMICHSACLQYQPHADDIFALGQCVSCNHGSTAHMLVGAPLPQYPVLPFHLTLCCNVGCYGLVKTAGEECWLCTSGANMELVMEANQRQAQQQAEMEEAFRKWVNQQQQAADSDPSASGPQPIPLPSFPADASVLLPFNPPPTVEASTTVSTDPVPPPSTTAITTATDTPTIAKEATTAESATSTMDDKESTVTKTATAATTKEVSEEGEFVI